MNPEETKPTETEAPVSMPEQAPESAPTPVTASPFDAPPAGSQPMPAESGAMSSGSSSPKKRLSFKLSKTVALITAAVVVLAGGGAAAYFGVVVPNKPENVLRKAVINTLEADQATYKGTLEATDDQGVNGKVEFTVAQNLPKKASDAKLSVTVSGVALTIEVRLLDGNIYINPGDLAKLSNSLSTLSPQASYVLAPLTKYSDKWIVIDSSVLKTAGLDCVIDSIYSSQASMKADVAALETQFKAHPFTKIDKSSSDTLNGNKATKMEIKLDDNEAAAFIKNAASATSASKSLKTCTEKSSAGAVSVDSQLKDIKGDGKTHNFTVWVQDNHIAKVAYAAQSKSEPTASFTIDYAAVNIEKPADAVSIVDVFTDLANQLGVSPQDLISSFSGGSTGSGQ